MIASNPQEKELHDPATCWALVQEIAESTPFKRAARMRELLLYISRRCLIDRCDQLREQEIGAAVFGRPDGYDTSVDTIVRVSASELRKRVDAYFSSEGLHQQLIMEIPRGSYIPIFRNRPAPTPVINQPVSSPVAPVAQQPEVIPAIKQFSGPRLWIIAGLVMGLLAVGCCIAMWIENHHLSAENYALHIAMNGWPYQPAVSSLWSGFLGTNKVTDIVMSDESLLLIQGSTKHFPSFDEYLNRSYLNQFSGQTNDPALKSLLSTIGSKALVSSDEIRLAQKIVALDPLNKRIHLYDAREYAATFLKDDNVILIGSQFSNPWVGLFDKNLNFTRNLADNGVANVINRSPKQGEQSSYSGTIDIGYCLVAYLPNPDGDGKLLLIEGTSAEASEAAGEFILSENHLSSFMKMLHVEKLPYFEVVLRTSEVRGTPFNATVESYRTYPNLH